MRTEMKKILIVTLLTALSACNTVAGLGEDVSGGARTVQNMMN
jgi:predicted small secreted protein